MLRYGATNTVTSMTNSNNTLSHATPCVLMTCCMYGSGEAPAGTLQQMAHGLAASKQARSGQSVCNRALLHQLAAQAHFQNGRNVVSATLLCRSLPTECVASASLHVHDHQKTRAQAVISCALSLPFITRQAGDKTSDICMHVHTASSHMAQETRY